VLRYRGTSIEDRFFGGDGAITVGECSTSTFVLPGIGEAARTLLSGRCLHPVEALGGVVKRASGARPLGGIDRPLRFAPGDSAELFLHEHRDVRLWVEREPVERVSLGRRASSYMLRELLYGLSFAVCLLALLAIERPTSTAIAGGDPDAGSLRIARFMFAGPGAPTMSRFPAPVLPAPESREEPAPESREEPAPDATEPVTEPTASAPSRPVASTSPKRKKKASRPPSSNRATGGRSSHGAKGQPEAKGRAEGTAAVDGERRCADPVSVKKDHVDVVFVIDVSTTMGFVLDALAREIEAVDAEVRKHDDAPRYGLVLFVDDVMVANGGRPFASIAALRAEFQRWAAFASSNRQIHTTAYNMDWPENSLDALYLAATRFQWRPAEDTLRLVVHATDDDFGEHGAVQSGQPVRHTYRGTVEALERASVRVATFAARIGGQCECVDVSPGWFTAYRGQPSIPDATGGAAFDIDEVALGKLALSDAVAATVESTVCREYLAPWQ